MPERQGLSMLKHFLKCTAVALVAALAGCQSMSVFQGEATPWDGRWTGRMTFSSGYASCPRRGTIQVQIASGDLDGSVRTHSRNFGLSGRIDQAGGLKQSFISQHGQPIIDLTGQFDGDTFSGRWEDIKRNCRGSWELRRS